MRAVYAIAVMMHVLSGVLTGSGFGVQIAGPYQAERGSRAWQLIIALSIDAMQPLAEFNARMEELISQIKSVPRPRLFPRSSIFRTLHSRI